MSSTKEPIDKLFRDGLYNHKIEPRPGGWAKINSQLPASKPKAAWYNNKSRILALALLLSFGSFLGGYFAADLDNASNNIVQNEVENTKPNNKLFESETRLNNVIVTPVLNNNVANISDDNTANTAKQNGIEAKDVSTKNSGSKNNLNSNLNSSAKQHQLSLISKSSLGSVNKSKSSIANKLVSFSNNDKSNLEKSFLVGAIMALNPNMLSNEKIFSPVSFLSPSLDLEPAINTASPLSRWAIGAIYSYDANMRTIRNNESSTNIETTEELDYCYTKGLQAQYYISERFSLLARLNLTQKAVKRHLLITQEPEDVEDPFGGNSNNIIDPEIIKQINQDNPDEPIITNIDARYNYTYVELPILAQYQFNVHKKWALSVGAGFSTSFLINNTVNYSINQNGIVDKSDAKPTNNANKVLIGSTIETALQYKLSRKTSINLMQSARYSFTPLDTEQDFIAHPYTLGLGLGIMYRL